MPSRETPRETLAADFEPRLFSHRGETKRVFVSGAGPAIIVMSEVLGISAEVARFARWLRDAGFSVYLPNLFGEPGSLPARIRCTT